MPNQNFQTKFLTCSRNKYLMKRRLKNNIMKTSFDNTNGKKRWIK